MRALEIAVATTSLLIWLYLLSGRGGFWRVTLFASGHTAQAPRIVAIIPARNEAAVIAQSIRSLQHQNIHVFVIDDNSSDDTAGVARDAIQSSSLTVIHGAPLPIGWSGKLWALQQGLQAASAINPDFFLFTDADIVHSPRDLARLIATANAGGYDLASLMVRLRCSAFAEKLLIPAFVFFFFKVYPPAWIAAPDRPDSGAAGGCILIRPAALARAGGITAIRTEIIDDCALAHAIKGSGGKVWLGLAQESSSIRPYRTFAEIERMISRTAFSQLRHSALRLLGTIAGLMLTYVAPIALLFTASPLPVALAAASCAIMVLIYVPMVRYYRLNPAWALTLPFAALFYSVATVHSAFKFWFGRGGEWKGRMQDLPTPQG